jgi:hypothetical protein
LPACASTAMIVAAEMGMGKSTCGKCETEVPFGGRCCGQYWMD